MKTTEELLTDVKRSAEHLQIFGSKAWALVTDKTRKASDAIERSGVRLRCISYGKFRVMFEDDQTIGKTRHLLVGEDVFPMKQW